MNKIIRAETLKGLSSYIRTFGDSPKHIDTLCVELRSSPNFFEMTTVTLGELEININCYVVV